MGVTGERSAWFHWDCRPCLKSVPLSWLCWAPLQRELLAVHSDTAGLPAHATGVTELDAGLPFMCYLFWEAELLKKGEKEREGS